MNFKKSIGWAGILSLVGVALSFCSQLVFSYFFGTTSALDAYWVAFAIMYFLAFPFISLREALVSEIHERSLKDPAEASIYFSKAITLILTVALIGSAVGIIFSKPLINLVVGGENTSFHSEVLVKLLWLAPALILLALSDTFNGLLTSYNRAILQMLSRILAAGSTVVIIALAANWIGSQALVLGFVMGQAVNVIVLTIVLYRQGLSFKPSYPSGLGSTFFYLSGALFCSYGINQVYAVYEKSTLLSFGVGLVSAFQYSVSITNIIITVLGLSLANLLWPRFLNHVANQNTRHFYSESALSIKILLIILGWVCALIFLHAQWVVETVFARGAFAGEAITLTSLCLKMTIFSAIPVSINFVLGRAMISARASKSIMLVGFTTAISGMLILFLAGQFREPRLAMSFWFIANILGCTLSGILFLRQTQVQGATFRNSFFWILRYVIAVLVSVALAYEFLDNLNHFSNFQLINIVCQSVIFTLIYLVIVAIAGLFKNLPFSRLMGRA